MYFFPVESKKLICQRDTNGASLTNVYFPALDSMRAIAILFVLIEHWIEPLRFIPWGTMGVGLFFVLSGFLIGRILLIEKLKKWRSPNPTSNKEILKKFYIRRTLRIFPIYFIYIGILSIINYPSQILDLLPWLITYTTNIKISVVSNADQIWPLTHLWTLAVEEQFYLIIPLIILVTPWKYIPVTIVFIILSGSLSRTYLYLEQYRYYNWFTTSAFDYFGSGILLAYFNISGFKISNHIKSILFAVCLILILYFYLPVFHFRGKSLLNVCLPVIPLFYFLIIDYATQTRNLTIIKLSENKILKYIGKISYGIYLYHTIVPYLREFLTGPVDYPSDIFKFVADAGITILIAAISFKFIEMPFNNLKNRFTYS